MLNELGLHTKMCMMDNKYNPAGIFDVDSTLNRRRNFNGGRKSVDDSTSNRRRYFNGFLFGVEKALKIQRRNLPAGYCKEDMVFNRDHEVEPVTMCVVASDRPVKVLSD